ncbi:MAG: hypothetical protein H0U25_08220 [Thermoleophilaceae bacterium]|nr:hypothetical protein [Thermoleophilaceae bacterium]
MTLLTRRALLIRVAGSAAVAGVAARWPLGPTGPSSSADSSTSLTSAGRRRYAELVAAVVALEGGRASAGYVRRATAVFSGWYSRNPGLRAMVDLVLDEAVAAGGAQRLLTDTGVDEDPGSDARFGTRGNRRRVLAGEALRLASPPYAPDRS